MNTHNVNLSPPKTKMNLHPEEVHVWLVGLDRPQVEVDRSFSFLSPDEQVRATQFYFKKDRTRFIVAHGALRAILSSYLEAKPAEIRIITTPDNKPILEDAHKTSDGRICFNLSHAAGIALNIVALNRQVGIDIEYIHPSLDFDPLINRFFSPDERKALEVIPSPERKQMFYRYWVLKEAYIKAIGEGLSCPLESFSVSFDVLNDSPLLDVPMNPKESSRWSLKELQPGHGYIGALVAEGQGWMMKCYELDGF